MLSKNQNNLELFIGIAFVLVLGAALFSIVMKNNLPGAESDPIVKVKDTESTTDLDFDSVVSNNGTGTKNTVTSNSTDNEDSKSLDSAKEDNISENTNIKTYTKAPNLIIKPETDYKAVLTTSAGPITIDLFEDKTPITVNNFVFLSQEGFYNGTRSHRIIKNFMVQFGDPLTKDSSLKNQWGTGNPGYRFPDEPFDGEYKRGIVAMANSGPNTNGSQFFIMHQDNPLPKNYVIFGQVTDEASLSVLDNIANVTVTRSPSGESSFPVTDVMIENIEIQEN